MGPQTSRSILICDDDPMILASLRATFCAAGFRTGTCESFDAMLEMLDKQRYDALLLDHFLGPSLGAELVPTVRSLHPHLIIVIVTAHGTVDLAVAAMAKGAAAFLTKGASPDRMVTLIDDQIACRDEKLCYASAKQEFERAFIHRVLAAADGSIAEAARLSGRYRSDIYRLAQRYGVMAKNFRPDVSEADLTQ